ncbi:5'/3'-nucleotidase SurE [Chitinimonas koreensis]|uniref:5'/3'-nucleotidase SurE n=1 Tax=Chitinimonas koreensis TaxID=356302 RepID=UPI0004178CF3|nr:5'/3'-nucleotidase SurE [Chitinimonas koreensis]QNM95401.1 5'/3'-nucleotidase SurE [Chitinimonas koreensis]
MRLRFILPALSLAGLAGPAFALNIVLSNDDGLSANVKALYAELKAAGHDVVVSVPCQNQSGKGASANFLTPITPLAKACRNAAAAVGAPGVGPIAGLTDFHYVDGTPVMATLYGIDVLAAARWNKAPDLVLSGPNEGQNTGSIVNSSGTVSNAQIAASRGLPAIAVSADTNTTDQDGLAAEAAKLTLKLVAALQARAGSGPLLPAGVALNVNFPKFEAGKSAALAWSFSRHGSYNAYNLKFVADLSQDPVAKAYGLGAYAYPGLSLYPPAAAPSAEQASDEAAVNAAGRIAVTAMQVGFEARPAAQQWLRLRLRDLLVQ